MNEIYIKHNINIVANKLSCYINNRILQDTKQLNIDLFIPQKLEQYTHDMSLKQIFKGIQHKTIYVAENKVISNTVHLIYTHISSNIHMLSKEFNVSVVKLRVKLLDIYNNNKHTNIKYKHIYKIICNILKELFYAK